MSNLVLSTKADQTAVLAKPTGTTCFRQECAFRKAVGRPCILSLACLCQRVENTKGRKRNPYKYGCALTHCGA